MSFAYDKTAPTPEDRERAAAWQYAIDTNATAWRLLAPRHQDAIRARIKWASCAVAVSVEARDEGNEK